MKQDITMIKYLFRMSVVINGPLIIADIPKKLKEGLLKTVSYAKDKREISSEGHIKEHLLSRKSG